METKNKLLLVGGGGHCKSIIDSIINHKVWSDIKIIDLGIEKGTLIDSIEVIGKDDDLLELYKSGYTHAFVSLGSVGNTDKRKKIFNFLKKIGFVIPIIIDSTSIISKFSYIGEGSYIGKKVIINSNVTLGICSIINTGAIVEHDCEIGDFVHVAPGSVISGTVKIGSNTHIGTNSTIKNNVIIGKDTIIGVGSVVVNNIASNVIAFGNPCREVKK
jgi:sugar O-acyltransferase (sialic acid O-acetyltransferase NeuD family)